LQDQGTSLPNDGQLGHLLLHMQLETRALGVLVTSYCCSTYRVADPFRPAFHPIDDFEHPLLYLLGTCITSQERAISGSFQQNLPRIYNSVCVWWLIMGWIPGWGSLWMILLSVSAPYFVSVTLSMGILFPILRRNEVSILCSSFFLIFRYLANCILGILIF
jgi:hypothetical protein